MMFQALYYVLNVIRLPTTTQSISYLLDHVNAL